MSNPDVQRDYEVTSDHVDFSRYVAELRRHKTVLDEYGQALSMKMDNYYNALPERQKWAIPDKDFFYNCGAAMVRDGAIPPMFTVNSLEPELSDLRLRREAGVAKFKEKQTGVKQW